MKLPDLIIYFAAIALLYMFIASYVESTECKNEGGLWVGGKCIHKPTGTLFRVRK